jgi:ABC-2 family transporter
MTLVLRSLLAKELRALWPVWGGCAAALILAGVPGDPNLSALALIAYVIGAVALGAMSMGHEYTDRTLGLLLSQPLERRWLLLAKSGAVALMLTALALVAQAALFSGRALHLGFAPIEALAPHAAALLILPALAGLCLAPVLTMIGRGPMAGIVFTTGVLGLAWGSAQGLVLFEEGTLRTEGSSLDVLRWSGLWYVATGLSALAAIAGWRMFMRLEAIEGRGQDVHLPQWLARTARQPTASAPWRRRHPLWQLLRKELHLQQMTIVVAGLYILCWVAISAVRPLIPEDIAGQLDAVMFLYAPLLALLAGSLASAEERQFGTLEWQVLLPLDVGRQWAVKAGVAFGLAFGLGLGLPALLETIRPSGIELHGMARSVGPLILVLVSIGLYVSTVATSGVRAMLLAIPVTLLLAICAGAASRRGVYLVMAHWSPGIDWLHLDSSAERTRFFLAWFRISVNGSCRCWGGYLPSSRCGSPFKIIAHPSDASAGCGSMPCAPERRSGSCSSRMCASTGWCRRF